MLLDDSCVCLPCDCMSREEPEVYKVDEQRAISMRFFYHVYADMIFLPRICGKTFKIYKGHITDAEQMTIRTYPKCASSSDLNREVCWCACVSQKWARTSLTSASENDRIVSFKSRLSWNLRVLISDADAVLFASSDSSPSSSFLPASVFLQFPSSLLLSS